MREALTFDGVDDAIGIPNQATLSANIFTLSLWVKPAHLRSQLQPLLVKGNIWYPHDGKNYMLYIAPNSLYVGFLAGRTLGAGVMGCFLI